jgi:hypothetical protein
MPYPRLKGNKANAQQLFPAPSDWSSIFLKKEVQKIKKQFFSFICVFF